MTIDIQMLRALATGYFPVLAVGDYDAVHRTYGPAFGPWRSVVAADVALAMGGGVEDAYTALTAAARDWQVLTDDDATRGFDAFALMPSGPTVRDVVVNCPHGLLVAHGLVRLLGSDSIQGSDPIHVERISAESPIKL